VCPANADGAAADRVTNADAFAHVAVVLAFSGAERQCITVTHVLAGPVGQPSAEQQPQQLAVELVLVDRPALPVEPASNVADVALQQLRRIDVGRRVDGLREVDDHQPPVPPQDVVGRQVAVDDAGGAHRAEAAQHLVACRLDVGPR
jgi:hypothetical protein